VNCRLLPEDTVKDVTETVIKALADPAISVKATTARDTGGFAAPAGDRQQRARPRMPCIRGCRSSRRWKQARPTAGSFRTAGIPTCRVSGMFLDEDDNREHGQDERVGVQDYYDALAFNYQLVRALAY
jgi:acetylornithine deacetylase/succinyl-diaminopimelate desuccinylase-like protein